MLRAVLLTAGLAAALTAVAPGQPASEASESAGQAAWVKHHVQAVEPGSVYRLDACFTVGEPGVTFVSLRIAWHGQVSGYGPTIIVDDRPGDPSAVGSQQCLSLTDAQAPCAALSARYGVIAKGNPTAVDASGLELTVDQSAPAVSCATPSPAPSPPATPTPTSTTTPPPPNTTQTPRPEPQTPGDATPGEAEPQVFGSLVNGSFEAVRQDGTPYGWRKFGGEMGISTAFRAEGQRSATLISTTESTKWLYQTVTVEGGGFYRLRAKGLNADGGVRELLLRISWYASEDGSGSQLETADSAPLGQPSSQFTEMDTGPAQAPPEARSAKVRLLVRPLSAAKAVAYFDDVTFGATSEKPAPAPTSSAGGSSSTTGGGTATLSTGAVPASPDRVGAVPLSSGSTALANVRAGARAEPSSPTSADGDRLTWPILLALAIPAAGIALLAADGLRRSRIDSADEPRL